MAIGPVQLVVLGLDGPGVHGEIVAELERLKESDTVRVVDALAVHKDADGEIEVRHPLEEIPHDSAAAVVLLEHHWAVPLRDAIARAGGHPISDGFISPLDLVEIGLVSGEEAAGLHRLEPA